MRVAPLLQLKVQGRIIETTGEHPFHVLERASNDGLLGWQPAGWLQPGDMLVSHDGQRITVEEIADTGRLTTVYNLKVSDFSTYFVGCAEWGFSVWAHNANCTPDDVRNAILEAELKPLEGRSPGKVMRLVDAQDWDGVRSYLRSKYPTASPESIDTAVTSLWRRTTPMGKIAEGYGMAAEAAFNSTTRRTPATTVDGTGRRVPVNESLNKRSL